MIKPKRTTAYKRSKHRAKYVRKDARSQIYRALYGAQQHTYNRRFHKRINDPAQDPTRELSSFWEYNQAKHVFDAFIDGAAFSPAQREILEQRLHALHIAAKRKQQQTETPL